MSRREESPLLTIPHLIEIQCRVLKSNPQEGPANSRRTTKLECLFFNTIFSIFFLPHGCTRRGSPEILCWVHLVSANWAYAEFFLLKNLTREFRVSFISLFVRTVVFGKELSLSLSLSLSRKKERKKERRRNLIARYVVVLFHARIAFFLWRVALAFVRTRTLDFFYLEEKEEEERLRHDDDDDDFFCVDDDFVFFFVFFEKLETTKRWVRLVRPKV